MYTIEITLENDKHDTDSYENFGYKREISDADSLYDAFVASRKGNSWKPSVQQYRANYLKNSAKLQKELKDRTYTIGNTTEFLLNERGKTRPITGQSFRDRIVGHALCDEVLTPELKKYIMYASGASQKGKGVKFTRDKLEQDLHHYYYTHGNNEGYILLMDFSKYYDNIRHDKLKDMYEKYINDETALWLINMLIDSQVIDVSYMSDEEYDNCLDTLFDSVKYRNENHNKTGTKYMHKHLDLGNQASQISGYMYPIPIDNYIKIVKGVKLYGRYNDDAYIIYEDKNYLTELLNEIKIKCTELGITLSEKKTRIYKLSDLYKFMQIGYSLSKSGKVKRRYSKKNFTRIKNKMKSLVHILNKDEYKYWFKSWINSNYKLLKKSQIYKLNDLYNNLIEKYKVIFT